MFAPVVSLAVGVVDGALTAAIGLTAPRGGNLASAIIAAAGDQRGRVWESI